MSNNSANHPPRPTCMRPSSKFTLKPTADTYSSSNILCHCFRTGPWNLTYTSRNYNLQELSFTGGSFAILLEYQMAVLLALRWGGFSPHWLADSQAKTSASGQCPWYQNDGARRQKTPSAKDVCHLLSSSPHITQAPKDKYSSHTPARRSWLCKDSCRLWN